MYSDNANKNLGPSYNLCPNCHENKPANKALCPKCNARYCPKCGSHLEDNQWICKGSGCYWKDADWKPKKRPLATRSGSERQFEESFAAGYFQCPNCRVAFSYERSSAIKCPGCGALMGDGSSYKITLEQYKKAKAEIPGIGRGNVASDPISPAFKSSYSPPGAPPPKTPPQVTRVPEPINYHYIEAPVSFETSKDRQHFHDEMGSRHGKIKIKMPDFKKVLKPVGIGLGALVILAGISFGIWAIINAPPSSPAATAKPAIADSLPVDSVQFTSVTDFGARITWHTDKPSTSQVEYGPTADMGNTTVLDSQLVTDHSVNLNNLKAETTYYFKVKSVAGKSASSAIVAQFKTAAPPDNVPPVISDIKITNISDTEALVTWKTSENATGLLQYGTSVSYGQNVDAGNNFTRDHSFKLTGLTPSTSYHFLVKSADASGNESVSADTTFLTLEPVKIGPEVGNRAPDFTLQTVDGKTVTLSSLRGHPVVLNIWRLECPACVYELPFIDEVYKSLGSSQQANKPLIYTVNLMDYQEHVQNLLNDNHYTFPILLDFKGDVMYGYSLKSIPMTFFIDANGIIKRVQTGRFDSADEFREILGAL